MPFGELPLGALAQMTGANTPRGTFVTAPLDDKGVATGFGDWGQSNAFQYMGGPIRVRDSSGKVLFSGEGADAANQAAAFAQNLSNTLGGKADWVIEQGERTINPDGTVGATRWVSGPTDTPKDSTLGLVSDIALPIIANAILPGSGLLSTMAGSALGSAASGALQGKSLGDIVTSAGLSAATAGLMKGTPIGSFVDKTIGSIPVVGDIAQKLGTIGTGAGTGAANAVGDEIIVNALPSFASSVVPSLVTPTLANSIASKYPTYQPPATSPMLEQPAAPSNAPAYNPLEDISVTGTRLPSISTPFVPAVSNLFSQTQYSGGENVRQPTNEQQQPVEEQPEIVATAQIKPEAVSGALSSVPAALATDAFGSKIGPEGDIVATAQPTAKPSSVLQSVPTVLDTAKTTYPEYTPPADTTTGPDLTVTAKDSSFLLPSVAGALASQTLPALNQNPAATTPEPKSDLEKIAEYARLAGLGVTALGSLFGGGAKSGAAGTIPAGLNGGLDPIFSAKLPTGPANIPGGVGTAANFAVRPQTEQDWLTYGQRPEQSFFNYVPQPTGMAHGGSFAAKHGGASPRTSFAVHGPGTGRSDDIPAVLSDGEYVMDAETVALLGDGSSKAGAQKLDDLRVKIRKHKGQKLAQGRFSADAKHPEAYLSGGRI